MNEGVVFVADQSGDLSDGPQIEPRMHRHLATIDMGGPLRVSPGLFNSEQDIDQLVIAINEISHQ